VQGGDRQRPEEVDRDHAAERDLPDRRLERQQHPHGGDPESGWRPEVSRAPLPEPGTSHGQEAGRCQEQAQPGRAGCLDPVQQRQEERGTELDRQHRGDRQRPRGHAFHGSGRSHRYRAAAP
jgi:hypothetical protein